MSVYTVYGEFSLEKTINECIIINSKNVLGLFLYALARQSVCPNTQAPCQ